MGEAGEAAVDRPRGNTATACGLICLPALSKACLGQTGYGIWLGKVVGVADLLTSAVREQAEREAVPRVDSVVVEPDRAPSAPRRVRALETQRLYAADWASFVTWCQAQRQGSLPATPDVVAHYLADLSGTLSSGALSRRACAIADRHRRAGHASPCADEAVRDVLRAARGAAAPRLGARRSSSVNALTAFLRRDAQRTPAAAARLVRMAVRCPGDLAGLRDRTLLLLAAAGVGGEQLLALDHEHVHLGHGQTRLVLPGRQGRADTVIVLARAPGLSCPVQALDAWLHASDTRFGPVFRKVDRWSNVEHARLRPDGLRRIWQRRAKAVDRRSRPRPAARAAA